MPNDEDKPEKAKTPQELLEKPLTQTVSLLGTFCLIFTTLTTANLDKLGLLKLPVYLIFGAVEIIIIAYVVHIYSYSSANHFRKLVPVIRIINRVFRSTLFSRASKLPYVVLAATLLLIALVFHTQLIDFATGSAPSSSIWIVPASDNVIQSDLQAAVDEALLRAKFRLASSSTKAGMILRFFDLSRNQSPADECPEGISPQRVDVTISVSAAHKISPDAHFHACGQGNPNMFQDDAEELAYHNAIESLAQQVAAFVGSWRS